MGSIPVFGANMKTTMKKAESKVAETILQKTQEVTIGNQTYLVAPPSTATLILVSELVAQMPQIELNTQEIMSESLRIAKDCKVLGDIVAVLILGAKNITKQMVKVRMYRFFGLIPCFEEVEIDNQKILAKEILEDVPPIELNTIVQKLLSGLDTAFFFSVSSFLIGVNLTKPTKQEETIQSGQ